jgi:uncharacterized protein (DUF433 family)
MNCSDCPDVEHIPGKVSGAWLVRGTRIPVDALLDNADEIARDIFEGLSIERARRIIAFARQQAPHPA